MLPSSHSVHQTGEQIDQSISLNKRKAPFRNSVFGPIHHLSFQTTCSPSAAIFPCDRRFFIFSL